MSDLDQTQQENLALYRRFLDAFNSGDLAEIPGVVPSLAALPPGCAFAARCPLADARCRQEQPPFTEHAPRHWSACFHAEHAASAYA